MEMHPAEAKFAELDCQVPLNFLLRNNRLRGQFSWNRVWFPVGESREIRPFNREQRRAIAKVRLTMSIASLAGISGLKCNQRRQTVGSPTLRPQALARLDRE